MPWHLVILKPRVYMETGPPGFSILRDTKTHIFSFFKLFCFLFEWPLNAERVFDWLRGGRFRLVQACWGWGNYKVPLFLPCLLCSQKLWPVFSEEPLLQEAESGIQRLAEDKERHRSEPWDIGGERQCQELHCSTGRYGSVCIPESVDTCVLVLCFLWCVVIEWCHCCVSTFQISREGCVCVYECFQMRVLMFPELARGGDVAREPQRNSAICSFNNSAVDCISPLVHH